MLGCLDEKIAEEVKGEFTVNSQPEVMRASSSSKTHDVRFYNETTRHGWTSCGMRIWDARQANPAEGFTCDKCRPCKKGLIQTVACNKTLPPPGSIDARNRSCKCSASKNCNGYGAWFDPKVGPMFIINSDCKLHDDADVEPHKISKR